MKCYSEISNYYRVNISRYERGKRTNARRGGEESRCRWLGWKKRGDGLCVEGDGGGRHGLCTRVETLKTHKYVGGYEQREYVVLAANQKCHVRIAILASLPSLFLTISPRKCVAIYETFSTLPPQRDFYFTPSCSCTRVSLDI